jgi:hypothetical protein
VQQLADPTPFDPQYSYSGWQANNPSKPLPAQQVDNDFANARTAINETQDALRDIRRSDGYLKNGIVTTESLAPNMSIGFTLRGNWMDATTYVAGDGVVYDEVFYKATISHVSSPATRPDLSPATWTFLTSLNAIGIPDGSITPEKLAASEAADFRSILGVNSTAETAAVANAAGNAGRDAAITTIRGGAASGRDTLVELSDALDAGIAGRLAVDGSNVGNTAAKTAFLAAIRAADADLALRKNVQTFTLAEKRQLALNFGMRAILVSEATITSTVGTIDIFLDNTQFIGFEIVLEALPTANDADLALRLSDDGATFVTAGSAYYDGSIYQNGSGTVSGPNGNRSYMLIGQGIGNAAGKGCVAKVSIPWANRGNGNTQRPKLDFEVNAQRGSDLAVNMKGAGFRAVVADVRGVQFYFLGTANIAWARYKVYGIVQ